MKQHRILRSFTITLLLTSSAQGMKKTKIQLSGSKSFGKSSVIAASGEYSKNKFYIGSTRNKPAKILHFSKENAFYMVPSDKKNTYTSDFDPYTAISSFDINKSGSIIVALQKKSPFISILKKKKKGYDHSLMRSENKQKPSAICILGKNQVLVGYQDGTINRIILEPKEDRDGFPMLIDVSRHEARITGITTQGNTVLSCSADGDIKLWKIKDNRSIAIEIKGTVPTSIRRGPNQYYALMRDNTIATGPLNNFLKSKQVFLPDNYKKKKILDIVPTQTKHEVLCVFKNFLCTLNTENNKIITQYPMEKACKKFVSHKAIEPMPDKKNNFFLGIYQQGKNEKNIRFIDCKLDPQ